MLFSKISPKYKISSEIGQAAGPQNPIQIVNRNSICPDGADKKTFNPFRDLQAGGTTIKILGKNRWFADRTIVGKIMKFIFN